MIRNFFKWRYLRNNKASVGAYKYQSDRFIGPAFGHHVFQQASRLFAARKHNRQAALKKQLVWFVACPSLLFFTWIVYESIFALKMF
tara:strand:- start:161 stop:421 length:261 start_codon:yes stop_codon:yes gene_type:complete